MVDLGAPLANPGAPPNPQAGGFSGFLEWMAEKVFGKPDDDPNGGTLVDVKNDTVQVQNSGQAVATDKPKPKFT